MDRKEESYSRITADVKSICHRQYNMIYLMCSFERAIFQRVYLLIAKAIGLVAQLVRAPPCHGGGRGFEPHPGRYSKIAY